MKKFIGFLVKLKWDKKLKDLVKWEIDELNRKKLVARFFSIVLKDIPLSYILDNPQLISEIHYLRKYDETN